MNVTDTLGLITALQYVTIQTYLLNDKLQRFITQ